jgi:hypothetical protein
MIEITPVREFGHNTDEDHALLMAYNRFHKATEGCDAVVDFREGYGGPLQHRFDDKRTEYYVASGTGITFKK